MIFLGMLVANGILAYFEHIELMHSPSLHAVAHRQLADERVLVADATADPRLAQDDGIGDLDRAPHGEADGRQ